MKDVFIMIKVRVWMFIVLFFVYVVMFVYSIYFCYINKDKCDKYVNWVLLCELKV